MDRHLLLEQLLREVLSSPVSHTGIRAHGRSRTHPGHPDEVRRYTALRVDDELLGEIRANLTPSHKPAKLPTVGATLQNERKPSQ